MPGVQRRWSWAQCWPFDGSDLTEHPVSHLAPHLLPPLAGLVDEVWEAIEGPVGVVHSDLHREHLLTESDGQLGGVLDFGDAFIGSVAWDFAQLRWYYGTETMNSVARWHPHVPELGRRSQTLAVALGLYKLAKSPHDPRVLPRLDRVLSH